MKAEQLLEEIEDGNNTVGKISDSIDRDKQKVSIVLDTLYDIGVLEKETQNALKDGEEIEMYKLNGSSDIFTKEGDIKSMELSPKEKDSEPSHMPVNRDYDWDKMVPNDIEEYHQHDDEMVRITAEVNRRHDEKARDPVFWFTGPTGCGKTLAARKLADEMGAVLITIQGKYSMNESAILGSPMLVGDQTIWSDGPAVKALLASQERPVVLLIDEANRARPEAKEALYSVLDDRSQVTIERRGNEIIKGNPENLIVISTTNEGDGHITQKMDDAEKRRYGNKISFEYVGWDERTGDGERKEEHVERAARIVSNRSGAPMELSKELVDISNEIRRVAREEGTPINTGVPTSKIIDWAKTAYSYWHAGIDNSLVKAGEVTVINPFYGGDSRAENRVEEIIHNALDSAPVGEEEYENWSERDMNEFVEEVE